MTDKQIIKTLHSIKTYCRERQCHQCKFFGPNAIAFWGCQIQTLTNQLNSKSPNEWDMERLKEIIEK